MIDTDKFRDDKDDEIIFCTVRMYKLFLTQKNGIDAFQLYMHLMFSARLQKTNKVRATNIYLKRGLNWGEAKVKRAKSLLVKLGLIKYVRRRDKKTKQITGVYIKLSKIWSRETIIRRLSTG